MAIKTFKAYTPSRRKMSVLDNKDVITKSTPEKSLLAKKSKNAGRNNQGKITVRHHGGGNRQKYRIIDFKRKKDGVVGRVMAIEYDPNRTANIALIYYKDGTPNGTPCTDETAPSVSAVSVGHCRGRATSAALPLLSVLVSCRFSFYWYFQRTTSTAVPLVITLAVGES